MKGWWKVLELKDLTIQNIEGDKSNLWDILTALGFGLLIVDQEGRVREGNEIALKVICLSGEEELSGKLITEAFEKAETFMTKLRLGEDIARACLKLRESQARLPTFIYSINKGHDNSSYWLVVFYPYSECYIESDARELSKELETILDSSFDGIGVISGEGRVIRLNKSYEKITGLKAEELVGCYLTDLIKRGVFSEAPSLIAIKEKRPVTMTQRLWNGTEVLITGNPVFDEGGNLVKVVANIRNMSEVNRLKAESESYRELISRYSAEIKELRAKQIAEGEVITRSPEMIMVIERAIRAAKTDCGVLITGESGTGKEVIVKLIHKLSSRAEGPFIQVNCAAIPDSLLESELFGYEKGAFSGASTSGKLGLMELAHGGTLVLDEIGDLSPNLQPKLLRAVENQKIYRVGGNKPIALNIRIIALTNKNLEEKVKSGSFRLDLYYRLNVISLEVPPLRKRRDDIIPLLMHYLQKFNQKYNRDCYFDSELLLLLEQYDWPGNVRELRNIVERLVVMSEKSCIALKDVSLLGSSFTNKLEKGISNESMVLEIRDLVPLKEAEEVLEKQLLEKAFQKYKSARKVAKVLGITHPTVIRKKEQYGI